jgi:hypothetical protein
MPILTSVYCALFSKSTKKANCILAKWEQHCVLPFHSCLTSDNTDALIAKISENNDYNDIQKLSNIIEAIDDWLYVARSNRTSKRINFVENFKAEIERQLTNITPNTKVNNSRSLIDDLGELSTDDELDRDSTLYSPNIPSNNPHFTPLPKLIDDGVRKDEEAIIKIVNAGYRQYKQDMKNIFHFVPEIKKADDIQAACNDTQKEHLFNFFKIIKTIEQNITYLKTWVYHINDSDITDAAVKTDRVKQASVIHEELSRSAKEIDKIHQNITQQNPSFPGLYNFKNRENRTGTLKHFFSYALMPLTSLLVDLESVFDSFYACCNCGLLW